MTEKDPIKLFEEWYEEAEESGIKEPNAVSLATATKAGKPSNRMVLIKGCDENGFIFYTNLESQKGKEIKENPYASMCFFWHTTDKQVRIEGRLEQVSDEDANNYFDSRPINSRIGAIVSKQSKKIKENDFEIFKSSALKSFSLLATNKIKRPDYWSGFLLIPERIEFWQRGDFRIHKRTNFKKVGSNWEMSFLYP